MRLFDHPGCHGDCAFKQIALAILELDEISDDKNHAAMRSRVQEMKRELFRLIDEQDRMRSTLGSAEDLMEEMK